MSKDGKKILTQVHRILNEDGWYTNLKSKAGKVYVMDAGSQIPRRLNDRINASLRGFAKHVTIYPTMRDDIVFIEVNTEEEC